MKTMKYKGYAARRDAFTRFELLFKASASYPAAGDRHVRLRHQSNIREVMNDEWQKKKSAKSTSMVQDV